MKSNLSIHIAMSLTDSEIAVLDQIAAQNRRTRSDVARIILEDLVDERVTINDVPDIVVKRSPAGVRVTEDFKQRFDAFRAAGAEPGLLRLLLPRAAALARIMPERHAQFPDRAELEALASPGLPRQLSADLSALLAALSLRSALPAARRPAAARMAPAGAQPS